MLRKFIKCVLSFLGCMAALAFIGVICCVFVGLCIVLPTYLVVKFFPWSFLVLFIFWVIFIEPNT